MTDPNIVEWAAKAHWDAKRYSTSRAWDELKPEERTKAMRHIRAAIQAIREPTDAMIVAGIAERHGQPVPEAWSKATANVYRAMIEAGGAII